jgi:acetate kinase
VELVRRHTVNCLTVNPGSSSLKLAVIGPDDEVVAEDEHVTTGIQGAGIQGAGIQGAGIDRDALDRFVAAAPPLGAAAVRLVHGGTVARSAALLDDDLRARLDSVADLAPLHNPLSLDALDALRERCPTTPLVVCVDTAFHATIPDAAATYAVPWDWTTRHAIRKYGFHGLSHAYASRRAAELLAASPRSRLVTCHLGAGALLAAVRDGVSVDTTMGFTPLDGLVMATRAGAVDPGVVTWIQRHERLSPEEMERVLDRESGLLGVSGRSGDVRELTAAADAGDERARLALDVMLHRLATSIGAMMVAAGGVDALVFTGGVGEHSAPVRRAVADRLAFLGVALGPANESDPSPVDTDVSAANAPVRTLVVRAREDLEMAREARALLFS